MRKHDWKFSSNLLRVFLWCLQCSAHVDMPACRKQRADYVTTWNYLTESGCFNSLVPEKCSNNFKNVIFEHMLRITFMNTSCKITSHYFSQYWPRRMSPYGVPCRIKTGSGGVCCHNARGRVRNRKSNPDGVAGGIWRTVRTSPSALWQQTPTDRS